MSTTITLAECPDCGEHYVYWADLHLFRCTGCPVEERHELAEQDIYLEHNERWTLVREVRDDFPPRMLLGIQTTEEA